MSNIDKINILKKIYHISKKCFVEELQILIDIRVILLE